MPLLIFQTLPPIFSFAAVVVLLQACIVLFATGRRFMRKASYATVGIAGAAMGEGAALAVFPAAAWPAMVAGLAGGILLCRYIRPVGVGLTLAFLGFSVSTYLVNLEYVQYVAALVLFTYGFLLTDLAPTFVAVLLASAIILLSGISTGIPIPTLLTAISLVAGARIAVAVVPSRLRLR